MKRLEIRALICALGLIPAGSALAEQPPYGPILLSQTEATGPDDPVQETVKPEPRPVEIKKPVSIRIQVIEVTKKGNFDARLTRFKNALPAFDGARLVDELETKVEPKSAVTLQIHGTPTTLRVTVLKVEPDLTVKLKVDIDAFKFSAKTTHLRRKATTMVGKMIDKDRGLYLAVTTRVEP
ncbi:MAG: hypothetical protein U1E65_08030 [Myxococcota bacterium]